MPLPPFLGLTAIGSTLWSFAFVGIGYGLGSSYKSFEHDFRYVEYAIAVALVAAVALLVYRWRAAATVAARADDSPR
jgi:membrane protein DedA with SNARE-associated domain